MSNIFDLKKQSKSQTKKSPKKYQPTEVSDEEKKLLLVGYVEVPYEQWGGITKYSHIRYERKGGLFRKGGYVNSNWKSTDENGNSTMFIKLVSKPYDKPNKDKNPYWILSLKDISNIWRRITTSEKKAENIDILQKMQAEIVKLREEQIKIINLIKKLHGVES